MRLNKSDADVTDFEKAYQIIMEGRKPVPYGLTVLRNTVLFVLPMALYRYLVEGTQNYLFHHDLLDYAVAACVVLSLACALDCIRYRRQLDAVLMLLGKQLEQSGLTEPRTRGD